MRSIGLVTLLVAAPCAAHHLVRVPPPDLGATCDDLDTKPLIAAIEREISVLRLLPSTPGIPVGDFPIPPSNYAGITLDRIVKLARKGTRALCLGLRRDFWFYRDTAAGEGEFTAYHNPLLHGSRARHGPYQHPIYRHPPKELESLPTEKILAGALDGKGLEIVYLDDATAALAAHVEGSGTVLLDDNRVINITTDGNNGRPYQNVSKLLLADNKIPKDQVTPPGMTRARAYFLQHPDQIASYWSKNPHFVFFKESTTPPRGKFGELAAGRTIAVDPDYIPLGAAVWMRTDKPAFKNDQVAAWVSYGRVVLAGDTGAAIKGPGRVDVFFGTGEYAEQASAVTTRPGEVYVLVAKY